MKLTPGINRSIAGIRGPFYSIKSIPFYSILFITPLTATKGLRSKGRIFCFYCLVSEISCRFFFALTTLPTLETLVLEYSNAIILGLYHSIGNGSRATQQSNMPSYFYVIDWPE